MPAKSSSPTTVASSAIKDDPSSKVVTQPTDPDQLTFEDIKEHMRHIERAISTKESHYMARMVRGITTIRQRLNCKILRRLVETYFPTNSPQKSYFSEFLPEAMDKDSTGLTGNHSVPLSQRARSSRPGGVLLPEVDIYLHLLLLIFLEDSHRKDEAVQCGDLLLERICEFNRRSMDPLAARCYFFYARAHELRDGSEEGLAALVPVLHTRLRICTLRHDFEGQAVLINLLLRAYIARKLYDQADKLVCRVTFPEASPIGEWARYLYYLGRIKAIRLEYTLAHVNLVAALRKAPQQQRAVGFRLSVHKLRIVVQLLLGELPDRAMFHEPAFAAQLRPYFELTQAVRLGDLTRFNEALARYSESFRADQMHTLILRLRHNVIKAGVRRISLSYSRISLRDVAVKLGLTAADSSQSDDVEYILAKAIRDRVIDATVEHEQGYLETHETLDVYASSEPFQQLSRRIQFCLNVRNRSVKAMRYPPKAMQDEEDEETPEERLEREALEIETAKELSEEDFDGF